MSRLLSTIEAAAFLTERGFNTAPATLEKLRSVGGGPAFTKFSRFPRYAEEDLIVWAEGKQTPKVTSTSQLQSSAT